MGNKRYISQDEARKIFGLEYLEKQGLKTTVQLSSAKYNDGIREGVDHFIRNLADSFDSDKFEYNENSTPDIGGSRSREEIEEQKNRLEDMRQKLRSQIQ